MGSRQKSTPAIPCPRTDGSSPQRRGSSTFCWNRVQWLTAQSPHPTHLRQGPPQVKYLPGLCVIELLNRGCPTGTWHHWALPGCSKEEPCTAPPQPCCHQGGKASWQRGHPGWAAAPITAPKLLIWGEFLKTKKTKPDAPLNISGIHKARSFIPNATNFLSHDASCLVLSASTPSLPASR